MPSIRRSCAMPSMPSTIMTWKGKWPKLKRTALEHAAGYLNRSRQAALAGAGKVKLMLPAYVTDPSREHRGRDNAIEAMAKHLEAVIAPLCKDGGPYALLDLPDHSNVGDSAILLGELVLLHRLFGRNPSFVSSGSMFRKGWGRHMHPARRFSFTAGKFGRFMAWKSTL